MDDITEAMAFKFPQHFPNGPAKPLHWYDVHGKCCGHIDFVVDGENVVQAAVPVSPKLYMAFEEGRGDFRAGRRIQDCPYEPNTTTASQCAFMWRFGFNYEKRGGTTQ